MYRFVDRVFPVLVLVLGQSWQSQQVGVRRIVLMHLHLDRILFRMGILMRQDSHILRVSLRVLVAMPTLLAEYNRLLALLVSVHTLPKAC